MFPECLIKVESSISRFKIEKRCKYEEKMQLCPDYLSESTEDDMGIARDKGDRVDI